MFITIEKTIMQETIGDIFNFLQDPQTDAICIFTNGMTNNQGLAMAGAGQAGIASSKWTNFRSRLGRHLRENGNIVGLLGEINKEGKLINRQEKSNNPSLISFPTKQHFLNPSIPKLIEQSAKQLVEIANNLRLNKVILGRAGCGFATGRLNWENDVKPILADIFNDRFVIVNME